MLVITWPLHKLHKKESLNSLGLSLITIVERPSSTPKKKENKEKNKKEKHKKEYNSHR